MKRFLLSLSLVVAAGLLLGDPAAKFTDLFNGKDLTGWKNAYEWGEAKVVDGEIHLTGSKKFFVATEKTYRNFIFEGDVKLPEGKANSGFMFRAHVEPNKVYGYQAEVDGDAERRWSGGLFDEGRRKWVWPSKEGKSQEAYLGHSEESLAHFAKPEVRNALRRTGWNTYRITCIDNKLKIEVNGVVTTEIEDDTDAEGHIAIQHHGEDGQTYKFRNLRIKELP